MYIKGLFSFAFKSHSVPYPYIHFFRCLFSVFLNVPSVRLSECLLAAAELADCEVCELNLNPVTGVHAHLGSPHHHTRRRRPSLDSSCTSKSMTATTTFTDSTQAQPSASTSTPLTSTPAESAAGGTTHKQSASLNTTVSPAQADDEAGKKKKTTKRRKVNHACLYCRRSHMTCDEGRPCQRWSVFKMSSLAHLTFEQYKTRDWTSMS